MQSDTREHVIVVGGGPIGMVVALLLARAGYRASVIEGREPAAARADRRLLALSRGTWQVLQPLLPTLPQHAPIDTVLVSSAGEFGSTRIDAAEIDPQHGQPLGVTVHYGELHAALESAVGQQSSIVLHRPRRATDVAQQHDGVSVTLDDGTVLQGALALHAEGQPGPADEARSAWALIADVQLQGPAPGVAFERFTREGPLALLPAAGPEGRGWSMVWCADEHAVARRGALPATALRAELQQAVGARKVIVTSVSRPQAVRLSPQSRARVHEHRVAWLGNAAQTLHPVAGQGFNLGVRDAVTLVEALAQQRRQRVTDVPAALADYGQRRATDRRVIEGVTRWLPPVFASRLWPLPVARSLGLTLLDVVPPLRRQWARLLMFGVRE